MRTFIRIMSQGQRAVAAALLCSAALAVPAVSHAEVRPFEVTVPLAGSTPEDRTAAMAEALRAVAVKASGRREAARNATVNGASPEKYVQRYSTTTDRMLKVGFDGRAVEQLLQQAGLPLWPAERPVVVVVAPVPDVAAVEAAAQARGLPIEWGSAASTPSASHALLVGEPGASDFGWSLVHGGRTIEARGSAVEGIHFAADTLAARYAPPSTRSSSELTIRVAGMDELADYSGLLAYLRELSLLRRVEVESLDGEVITLRVAVRGDRELLGRIAALDGRLQPGPEGATPAVDFVYRP